MRHIVVSKLGNEPDVFGDSLRCGMIGDWETFKLLQLLSDDPQNYVVYFGKAKWNLQEAYKRFNRHVTFVESSDNTDVLAMTAIAQVDEFHIILGPHAFYNGGFNMASWESIKKSIVTERLLERVAPQLKLMNANPQAKLFFYLSDRRFLLQAADFMRNDITVYAQSVEDTQYDRVRFNMFDYSCLHHLTTPVKPCRFETLYLYNKDYKEYEQNRDKQLVDKHINLVIPANQVTSDAEISYSRLPKLLRYTEVIKDCTVIGKWTSREAINKITNSTTVTQFLDGVDLPTYNKMLNKSEYALVLFNTSDSPECFIDNWITVKYWECVFNGCLTFVEATKTSNRFVPVELQVHTAEELRDKLRRCQEDNEYKLSLIALQDTLVKREYFSGKYMNDFIKEIRQNG